MNDITSSTSLQSAAEALRDKIRLGFVELIPAEQWTKMIEKELERFFRASTRSTAYGSEIVDSPFTQLVRSEVEQHVRGLVKKHLEDPKYNDRYMFDSVNLSDAVKTWMTENHEKVVKTAVEHLLGQGISQVLSMARMAR